MRNISKLFYKDYFKKINFNYLFENNDGTKKQIKKSNNSQIKSNNKRLIEDTANYWNKKVIENPCCNSKQSIDAKIQYPGLITGIGINHEASIEEEFKLGVHFDYTYGVPVIYGSSVKGVLRSAFPEKEVRKKENESEEERKERIRKNKIRECKCRMILNYLKEKDDKRLPEIDIDKFRDWIFEGIEKIEITKDNENNEKVKIHYLSIYKRDIFFDAVIKKPYEKKNRKGEVLYERILESDSITPHIKQDLSYEESMLKNPIPITFMKIASGVTMEFRFDLKDYVVNEKIVVSAEKKKELFKNIFKDFGIGAKTNVGYGQFSEVKSSAK